MSIHELRNKIDALDKEILIAMANRRDIVKQIGTKKQELDIPPKDETRWKEVIRSRMMQGKELGIPEHVVSSIWDIFHAWSLEIESKHED